MIHEQNPTAFTGVFDEEIDGNVGENSVCDLDVEDVRRRRVDHLLARFLGTDGVAARRRRPLRHLRIAVAEIEHCRVHCRRSGRRRCGRPRLMVDMVSGVRREVDEGELDALTGADGDRPRTVWSTVAERLRVVAGQITVDVFVVLSIVVGDELGLSKRRTVDRLNLIRCYNIHDSNDSYM